IKILLALVLLLLTFVSLDIYAKPADNFSKYKAATILSLIKYIDIGKTSNLSICISGDEEIQSIIKTHIDKKTNDKISTVKGFSSPDKEIANCDFLYISGSNPSLASASIGYASASNKPLV